MLSYMAKQLIHHNVPAAASEAHVWGHIMRHGGVKNNKNLKLSSRNVTRRAERKKFYSNKFRIKST